MVVRMVKKLVERFEIVEIGCFGERFIDDQIFDFVVRNECVIVCINDKGFKKRFCEKGVLVVYFCLKKILEFEGMFE